MATEVPVSLRRILALLVLVAALGTYLYVYELPQAEKEGKKDKLLAIDKDAVTGISLVFPDRRIDLRKDDKGWQLVKPLTAPADDGAVKGLVTTIADAEIQKTIDELPQDLASFGLDKPDPTVTLTLKDGTQTAPLAVGKNTAIGGKTYARKDDEAKLYLTGSSLHFGLAKQVKDLRDKQLLAFQDDDVTRVEIAPETGETTVLARKDKDSWTLQPGDRPADATEVRSYLASVRAARAVDFPDDAPTDLGKYGLVKPRLTITLRTGKDGSETRTLLFGGETTENSQKQVYAKRAAEPTVYALGDWSYRTLGKTPNQFRDKTVLGFDPTRVGKMVVERKDGGHVTLARGEQGAWTVDGVDGKPNLASIPRFLDDLHDLRGSDIVAEPASDLGPYGLDAPDLRITLIDKDGTEMGRIVAAKREKYYVMRAGGPTVFEARDYMYARLDKQPKDFVQTELKEPAVTATTTPLAQEPVIGDDEQAPGENEQDDEQNDD